MEQAWDNLRIDEIRILSYDRIKTTSSQLWCERTTIADGSGEHYDAISYVWGESSEAGSIVCNGLPVRAPVSLAPALRSVWDLWPDLRLWCDSICINQGDDREKGHQVAKMGQIYTSANRVIVWLGPDGSGSVAGACDMLKRVALKAPEMSDDNQLIEEIVDLTGMRLLNNLWLNPWFHRAWTFQEIRLARSAIFLCGANQTSLQQLLRGSRLHPTLSEKEEQKLAEDETVFFTQNRWKRFQKVAKSLQFRPTNDLTALLFDTWLRASSDERDKVYAVLSDRSLVNVNHGIRIDYKMPWSTVYIHTARACIKTNGDLRVLSVAALQYEKKYGEWSHRSLEKQNYIPSWVPDWQSFHPDLRSLGPVLEAPYFSAESTSQVQYPFPSIQVEDSSHLLKLKGITFGVLRLRLAERTTGGRSLPAAPPWNEGFYLHSFPGQGSKTLGEVMNWFRRNEAFHGSFKRPDPRNAGKSPSREVMTYSMRIGSPDTPNVKGQLPAGVTSGDWLCSLEGGAKLLVLRPALKCRRAQPDLDEDEELFVFVGEALVDMQRWGGGCVEAGRFALT